MHPRAADFEFPRGYSGQSIAKIIDGSGHVDKIRVDRTGNGRLHFFKSQVLRKLRKCTWQSPTRRERLATENYHDILSRRISTQHPARWEREDPVTEVKNAGQEVRSTLACVTSDAIRWRSEALHRNNSVSFPFISLNSGRMVGTVVSEAFSDRSYGKRRCRCRTNRRSSRCPSLRLNYNRLRTR